MKINILTVSNPVWFDEQHTGIQCKITTAEYPGEVFPFLATPHDMEQHGKDLFQKIVSGVYGPIAPYAETPIYIPSAQENKEKAENLLAESDWVNQPDVYDTNTIPHLLNRDEFLEYRSQLRMIAISPVDGILEWPSAVVAVWEK